MSKTTQFNVTRIKGFTDFSPELTKLFSDYYSRYFSTGAVKLSESLISASKDVFSDWEEENISLNSNQYFNNFTVVTEDLSKKLEYYKAFFLWMAIIGFVKDWEQSNNKQLHKGTPYYFCSVSSILQHDFDAGLMSMSRALQEDKRNYSNWHEFPAFSFLSLNNQRADQYFKAFVDKMIEFVRRRLDKQKGDDYKSTRSGKLTYEGLRENLLDKHSLKESIRYYFVYSVIRIWHLRRLHKKKLGDELIAPVIFSNALFDLLLVVEELFKLWNKKVGNGGDSFSHYYDALANLEGWNAISDLDVRKRGESNFQVWLNQLLTVNYVSNKGIKVQPLEADLILSYGLRNFSAHTLESQQVVWKNYTGVLQSVFNSLFKVVELSS